MKALFHGIVSLIIFTSLTISNQAITQSIAVETDSCQRSPVLKKLEVRTTKWYDPQLKRFMDRDFLFINNKTTEMLSVNKNNGNYSIYLFMENKVLCDKYEVFTNYLENRGLTNLRTLTEGSYDVSKTIGFYRNLLEVKINVKNQDEALVILNFILQLLGEHATGIESSKLMP